MAAQAPPLAGAVGPASEDVLPTGQALRLSGRRSPFSDNNNNSSSGGGGSRGATPVALQASSCPQPQQHPELQRVLERLLAGTVRGAVIGLTLRGGLHAVGSLLTALSSRRKRTVRLSTALEDTLRYAAFLASLAGVYIAADEGIAALAGKDRSARWRGLVAGMAAGPTLLLTGARNRHYSLATYILLRGLTLLIRVGNKERNKQRHPTLYAALAPTRIEHGDTLLMCVSCSQIIYSFIMMPHTLPANYVRFIRKQGAKELYVWQGVRELAERTSAGRPLGPLTCLAGTRHAQEVAPIPCHFFHPGQACLQHPLRMLLPAWGRALSVYLPVYLLPAALVHRQALLKRPLPILSKCLQGVARSSLFLSSYISLAFGGACLGHRVTGRSTGAVLAGFTWVGGLATLLEKKSRRMELALYVMSRSVESFCRCCIEWGVLHPRWLPPRLDVLLFASGVAAILHCYSDSNGVHRDVFRSKYLGVFDFVFGNTGFVEGSIKHVPSNQDLLRNVSFAVSSRIRARSLSHNSLSALGAAGSTGPPAAGVNGGGGSSGSSHNSSSMRVRSPSQLALHPVDELPAASGSTRAAAAAAAAGNALPDATSPSPRTSFERCSSSAAVLQRHQPTATVEGPGTSSSSSRDAEAGGGGSRA